MIVASLGRIARRDRGGVSEFLVGWIPIFGNLFDALTAIGVIEVLGWVVVREFKSLARLEQ